MRSTHLLATALCGVLAAPAAYAADLQPLDKYWLGAGVYQSNNGLVIRVDGEDQVNGTAVSLQDDLGFSDNELATLYKMGATLGGKHQIAVVGHRYGSHSSKVLSTELDINDELYQVDAAFEGDMDIDVISTSYTWFFKQDENSAFGVGLGLVFYSIDLDLAAEATVEVSEGGSKTVTAETHLGESAPLPMVRMQYSRVLNDHWRLNLELAGVWKSSGSVTGDAIDASVSVDYFPWDHFGFTFRYNYDNINLEYNKSSFRGTLDLRNRGPQLMAVVKF